MKINLYIGAFGSTVLLLDANVTGKIGPDKTCLQFSIIYRNIKLVKMILVKEFNLFLSADISI